MKQVILKPKKEESLLRFHPWVFSGAISHFSSEPAEGELVEVWSSNHHYLATGHFQVGSIMVRILTFKADEIIDQAFYERRLKVALQIRRTLGLTTRPNHNTYRLVHGEGDNLPGLVIDIYGSTAVMQAHSVGMHIQRNTIAAALANIMDGQIANIYYKSETTLPFKAQLGPENQYLLGGPSNDIAIENGLRFHVDWIKGQKTGFFVDQRDNRALLQQFAEGRNVLNMFCYTGGFSFYAMRGGANLVHSVDSSQKAIDLTKANVELNFPDDPRHQAFTDDAFRFLNNTSLPYNLIILDPPAFAKHKSAIPNALKGYTRLNQKALEIIQPNSILFTFSCSQAIDKEHFRAAVFTAAAAARRTVRILHQLHQPADHPINIFHPEGEYLKGLVLHVE